MQYLNFFASYNDDCMSMYNNYKVCFERINTSIDDYLSADSEQEDFKDIDKKYQQFLKDHRSSMAFKGSSGQLLAVYDVFFSNYAFFVGCKKGFSLRWTTSAKTYYANVPENKYPAVKDKRFNYVEFNTNDSPTNNLRLFPFIEESGKTVRLLMFSHNAFTEDVNFLTPYSSPKAGSYQLSVNVIDNLSFLIGSELENDKTVLNVSAVIKYCFHSGNLYPNTNQETQSGILTLIKEKSDRQMIGKNLFDDDFEIN